MNQEDINKIKSMITEYYPEMEDDILDFLDKILDAAPDISLEELDNVIQNLYQDNPNDIADKEQEKNERYLKMYEIAEAEYQKVLLAIEKYKSLDLANPGDFDIFVREFSFFFPEKIFRDIKKSIKNTKQKEFVMDLNDVKVFLDQHYIEAFAKIKLELDKQ